MAEPDPDLWPRTLQRLASHEALTTDDAAEVMRAIMTGDVTPAQVGGFLMALRTKGETVDEIEGLARTALEFAHPVSTSGPVLDTCGTGGDRSGTFTISTVSAIVVAGAGVTSPVMIARITSAAASAESASWDASRCSVRGQRSGSGSAMRQRTLARRPRVVGREGLV
jgi:anthranilate phosphoribosyltransferase